MVAHSQKKGATCEVEKKLHGTRKKNEGEGRGRMWRGHKQETKVGVFPRGVG